MGIKVAFVTGPEEHIGIKYLSAVLKGRGHSVGLFCDPQLFADESIHFPPMSRMFDRRNRLINEVCAFSPDLLAFSVCTDFFDWASSLAGMFKSRIDVPVILGGVHPTTSPGDVIGDKNVDMICVGEGEYPLAELADSMASGRKRTDIENIWFKVNGKVVRNPARSLVDLDNLPFPDHSIYYESQPFYRVGYSTAASRGCPFQCSYCCHSVLKPLGGGAGYYRVRSVAKLMEELDYGLRNYQFDLVRFQDDIFPYQISWLEDFAAQYGKKIARPFICCLHPSVVTKERLALLKNAGCREVRLGVQTFNAGVRKDVLNRNESNEDIARAIQLILESDIKLVAENMVGLPGQTNADVVESLQFYNLHRPARNHFFWLRYYPGLQIAKFKGGGVNNDQLGKSQVFTQGGDTYGKSIDPRLISAIGLMPFMSKRMYSGFLQRRVWRYLPVLFPLWLFNILANLSSSALSDCMQRSRTWKRYMHFIVKACLGH